MYPLPPDYDRLTDAGQKEARLNACCLQGTPAEFVTAWDFFRRTYLFPTPPDFFYGADLVESPPAHYEVVESIARSPMALRILPRGYSKSTIIDEIRMMLALTRPGFPSALCLASHAMVEDRSEIMQSQFRSNEFIINDFGEQVPVKGQGRFNLTAMTLRNGSTFRSFSSDSKIRGIRPRPRLIVLDDPEYDTKTATSTSALRRNFWKLLFRVLIPMGTKGTSLVWLATMISKQAACYFACSGEDARFDAWDTKVYDILQEDDDGALTPLWQAHHDIGDLDEIERRIGSAAFGTEYRNRPGENEERTFKVHPELCTYEISGDILPSPLTSPAIITHRALPPGGETPVAHQMELGQFVSKLSRMLLVDYAPTVGPDSDYSALVTLGFEAPQDVLWVLDCWHGRVKNDELVRRLMQMGQKWKPRVVGVEAISFQNQIYEMVAARLDQPENMGSWAPRVVPIRYHGGPHGHSKTERISGMAWRFDKYRIKLPSHLRSAAHWGTLWEQIQMFQSDSPDGNLQHDDLIDAVAMYQYVKRSRSGGIGEEDRRATTPLEHLMEGELHQDGLGFPWITGINADEIPQELVEKLITQNRDVNTRMPRVKRKSRWHKR